MSDDDSIDLKVAKLELERAMAELAKFGGREGESRPRDEPPYCSFCGAGKNNVKHLVAGPGVYICDECVTACRNIIDASKPSGGDK